MTDQETPFEHRLSVRAAPDRGSLRRLIAVLIVTTLLVTAGCSGPRIGGPATPHETVTPVSVSESRAASPSGANASLPPGVFPNGTVDLEAVLSAHDRALSNRSYRLRVWMAGAERPADPIGTVEPRRHWNTSFTVASDGDDEYYVAPGDAAGPEAQRSYWSGSNLYRVDQRNGSASVRTAVERPEDRFRPELSTIRLGFGTAKLPPEAVRVSHVDRDGNPLYRITVPSDPGASDRTDFESYSVVMYVTPAGLVRSLQAEFGFEVGQTRIDRRIMYTYSDVGTTTVTEPGWAPATDAMRSGTAGPDRSDTPGVEARSGVSDAERGHPVRRE